MNECTECASLLCLRACLCVCLRGLCVCVYLWFVRREPSVVCGVVVALQPPHRHPRVPPHRMHLSPAKLADRPQSPPQGSWTPPATESGVESLSLVRAWRGEAKKEAFGEQSPRRQMVPACLLVDG